MAPDLHIMLAASGTTAKPSCRPARGFASARQLAPSLRSGLRSGAEVLAPDLHIMLAASGTTAKPSCHEEVLA